MPKNKGKGGKKFRRGKHDNEHKRQLVLCNHLDNQCYGMVTKVLGSGRFNVNCYKLDDDIIKKIKELMDSKNPNDKYRISYLEKRFVMKQRICHVRGSMRKRVWINLNDLVLVSLRDFQDDKADIMYKYENYEVNDLKHKNDLPDLSELSEENIAFGDMMPSDSEDEEDNEYSEKLNYKKNHSSKFDDNELMHIPEGGYNMNNDHENNNINIENI